MLHRSIAGRCIHILVAISLLLMSMPAVSTAETEEPNDPSLVTMDRLYDSKDFNGESFGPARWLKDGSGYTTLEDSEEIEKGKDIVKYDPATGDREILVSASKLVPPDQNEPLGISDYRWSADGRRLLIYTNTRRVWRINSRGDYWVLTLGSYRLKKLGGDIEPSTIMFAKFSPDGNRVAYVHEKNIYVQNLRNLKITQITADGGDNIINGTSDWVYEEEFRLRDGFRWSPDGKRIAYWQFDTKGVETFHLIRNTDSLYPRLVPIQYPKVGTTNSACKVGVISVRGGRTRWFKTSDDTRNHYIPEMDWVDARTVVLQHLNRLQNTNEVMLCNARTGKVRTVFTDTDDAWLDVEGDVRWLEDKKSFLWLSERDGWRHLYRVSRSGKKVKLLTPGDYDVIRIESVDEQGGWVYLIASPENAAQRFLYRVRLNSPGKLKPVTPAEQGGTHSYQISTDSKWAFHTYSSFDNPPVIDLVTLPGHESVRIMAENSRLRETVGKLARRQTEFFRVDIGDGVLLDGWCIKPPDFDPQNKYPVLFYVYGEPAGQTVLDKWGGQRYLWHLMLAQRGCVVMSIDNRGTPAPRGRRWRKCVYRQIGILASADQAAAVRRVLDDRPYLDRDRVGVWGWSGGGSMTLNALFRYPDLYKTGVAIAFIANQRYYDTIYQERYMGLPEDNEEGFEQGSPITFADQLEGNLMIIYGTGDDNCHYQNFEALVNKLIAENKRFEMMSYPNRSHSINEGAGTRRHLFETITRYLAENLGFEQPAGE